MSNCAQAIKAWASKNEEKPEDAKVIKLCCQMPPINKMDNSLSTLKNCEHLALSTNMIDRMLPQSLSGMSNLKILSMGRNNLKKLERSCLEDVASTLEQLWISYNSISSLDGIACCSKLKALYCSNNLIKNFNELEKISSLENLVDVLFAGNPMYEEVGGKDKARIEILRYLPRLTKIDGVMVKKSEREEAQRPTTAAE